MAHTNATDDELCSDFRNSVKFNRLKSAAKQRKCLYEDTEFPATDRSVFTKQRPLDDDIVWKRPFEMHETPNFIVGGASREDVNQGVLGNCWLLAAIGSLTMHRELMDIVIQPDQSFYKDYHGLFHFRFWWFGKWHEVVIDDRLPTVNGQLIFNKSTEGGEFWSPLLEKAYAKFFGGYENLIGGKASDAMSTFTGGITETKSLANIDPDELFQLLHVIRGRTLMACSINRPGLALEEKTGTGLIAQHAYSITRVGHIRVTQPAGEKEQLIRLRNPWGNEAEWTGNWSDKSHEWSNVTEREKQRIGYTTLEDGEFWMSFADFHREFTDIEFCHLGPNTSDSSDKGGVWNKVSSFAKWTKGVNAGGCINNKEMFAKNPQLNIKLKSDGPPDAKNLLIVSLIQQNLKKDDKENMRVFKTFVGYRIYKMPEGRMKPLDLEHFKYNRCVTESETYINKREISGRHYLPDGNYIVIPTTYEPHQEGRYLLRIFSMVVTGLDELDSDEFEVKPVVNNISTEDFNNQQTESEKVLVQRLNRVRPAYEKLGGESEAIDAAKLRTILNTALCCNELGKEPLSFETCKSLISLMDVDRSGLMSFDEFSEMWNLLVKWKEVFLDCDKDRSGTFDVGELRQALKSCGFSMPNSIFQCIASRFSCDGGMLFEDFVSAVARLTALSNMFMQQAGKGGKTATFTLTEFFEKTIFI